MSESRVSGWQIVNETDPDLKDIEFENEAILKRAYSGSRQRPVESKNGLDSKIDDFSQSAYQSA